jgi:hypothetical protein
MYESGQNADLREALRRLEEALQHHGSELRTARGSASDPALQVLLRSIDMMEEEAQRLRTLLARD